MLIIYSSILSRYDIVSSLLGALLLEKDHDVQYFITGTLEGIFVYKAHQKFLLALHINIRSYIMQLDTAFHYPNTSDGSFEAKQKLPQAITPDYLAGN